ncbi:MAG TPA: flagellar biosynthesis protein FlgL [Anaeromyxobacter sp.]|nr:flagellar biosynthesis protein FlgL [Anaeromyxobacter sp.]
MRVTDTMFYDRAEVDGAAARSRLDQATATASSGLRVVQPGDDPGAAGALVSEGVNMQRIGAIATAAGRAADEVTAASDALGQIQTSLARASEIAVQLSSSQYGASERAGGAAEVQALISTILSDANTKVGDRYIFGGTADSAQPFDGLALAADGTVDASTGTYRGAADTRQVEIAPGVAQDASLRADVALRGVGGGVDVIATLTSLANALSANNAAGVAATVGQLSQGVSQVSTAQSQAGTCLDTLDTAVSANQAASSDAQKRIANLGDADEIQSASDLALAQHALDTSLTAISQSFKFSLVDKL